MLPGLFSHVFRSPPTKVKLVDSGANCVQCPAKVIEGQQGPGPSDAEWAVKKVLETRKSGQWQ